MKTLLEIIQLSEIYLKEKGIERAKREAEELMADVLGLRRIDLYLQFDRPLEASEVEKYRVVLRRRGRREPCQYIAGKVIFAGLQLEVNASVLIPRPETEILIENIANKLKRLPLEGKILWDMCTGSGYMGLALKKRFPQLTVYLSDISSEALEVAEKNAHQNGCEVTILKGDLFTPFIGKSCDFFVCNPPYVSELEFEGLEPEVKHYEPKLALVSGKSGLEFYQRIASELPHYLHQPGKAWFEIGSNQGEKIKNIFNQPCWTRSIVEPDWAGHDRFFSLERDSFLV